MLFDACCKYCCLLQSTAFTFAALWDFWMQICRDKTIQFLTQQYMFANVLVSLEGLRSAPMQCQKRFVVLRAQFFGCGICTAPQPWSMMMPITWLCLSHGSAVVDHVTNMEDKSISREWPTVRKIVKVRDGSQLQSEAPWLLGCNRWPLLCGIFNHMFLRVRVGRGQVF